MYGPGCDTYIHTYMHAYMHTGQGVMYGPGVIHEARLETRVTSVMGLIRAGGAGRTGYGEQWDKQVGHIALAVVLTFLLVLHTLA